MAEKYNFFRGFIEIKGKTPVQKFKKGETLLSYDEANTKEEFGGVLAEDAICIDIDDPDTSELMLDIVDNENIRCRVLKTTRGKHFYFRNTGDTKVSKCHTDVFLVCGIKADIKVGCSNSYAKQKSKGVLREIEYDIMDDEEYQTLPAWLMPVKNGLDLRNLDEGDGRNQTLFDYILKLNSMGLSKDTSRDCLRVINTYVFKKPLSESELETLSRDEAFPSDVFIDPKKGFLHDKFGKFLISECHIIRINGELHTYVDGVYVGGTKAIEKAMLRYIPNLKSNQRTECLKFIELNAREDVKVSDPKFIAFKNGIFDMESKQLFPFSPSIVVTNMIPHNYIKDSYNETCDNMLNKIACGDQKVRALIEEMVGACFYRSNTLAGGKAFILTGEKANGKSTFLEMVNETLGVENVSNLDLSEVSERFSIVDIAQKLANVGDDISDEFLQGKNISIFKKLVTGNRVKAEHKGEDVFNFVPYAKLLFSANSIPRTKDKTGAVLRRLVIIPFNATFSKKDPDYDPFISSKLKQESSIEYLIRIGIEGLDRVLENKCFTTTEKVENALKEYEAENNPILTFVDEIGVTGIINQITDDVYRRYRVFCIENGFTEITKINFSRQLGRSYGIVTKVIKIDGKLVRIYGYEKVTDVVTDD